MRSVYQLHVHFHVWITKDHLGIPLPNEDGFSKAKKIFVKSAYYSICDDFGVYMDEIWTDRDWLYTIGHWKGYTNSPPENCAQRVITQSKIFTRKDTGKKSRSVQTYFYLVL